MNKNMNTATVSDPGDRAQALGLSILRLARLAGVDSAKIYGAKRLKPDEAERVERVLRDAELEKESGGSV